MDHSSLFSALAQGLTAYSLGALLVLAATAFTAERFPQQMGVRWAGWGLLSALAMLQLAHAAWLWNLARMLDHPTYGLALLLVAPCFYLMALQVLRPTDPAPTRTTLVLHLGPAVAAFVLPMNWVFPLAFGLGAMYLGWLLRTLWPLRAQRIHWRKETWLLGAAAAIGAGVCGAGLAQAVGKSPAFYSVYAIAIGLLLLLVQVLLGLRPRLVQEVAEAVQTNAYATTTLSGVDVPAALARLDALMTVDHRYQDPELNLATVAQALALTPHQVSELVNTRMGKGFARYLREQRVQAARVMLLAEPNASVLSVGLSVGFNSQSNFYEAFREIEGSTPGQFRKINRARQTESTAPAAPD